MTTPNQGTSLTPLELPLLPTTLPGQRSESSVHTNGGSYIDGNVSVADGDFVARDKIVTVVNVVFHQFHDDKQPKRWDGRVPYIGLRAFEKKHAEFFFGREKLVAELVTAVSQHHFVCIAGPSGSGKSSLGSAGLLHALKQGACDGSTDWLYETMTPRGDPIAQLVNAVSALSTDVGNDMHKKSLTDANALHHAAELLARDARNQRVVLFVDQFEELFTQTQDTSVRQAFLNRLTTAVQHVEARVTVIIALRADFVEQCAAYTELRQLINASFHLIGAMDLGELARAIAQPAFKVGAQIEPALVTQVIEDMKGEPGALPLMQFALEDLFKAQAQQSGDIVELTHQEYLARGGIQKALERQANATFEQIEELGQQMIARSIFMGLIQIGLQGTATRRTATFAELRPAGIAAEQVDAVVQTLAAARLVVISDDQINPDQKTTQSGLPAPPTPTPYAYAVMIVHEKLIDAWSWLRGLVVESRTAIALQNQLNEDAAKWVKQKKDASYLYTGARLQATQEQLQTNQITLSELASAFVAMGIQEETARNAQAAAASRYARNLKRAIRATGIITLLLLIVLLGVAGLYALREQNTEAEAAASRARSGADRAIALISSDPMVALMHALDALPSVTDPKVYVPQAEFAVTQALRSSLERRSLQIADPPLTSQSIATGTNWIAVGGNELRLVPYSLDPSKVITLTGHISKPIQAVQWNTEGEVLLSRDSHYVHVWHNQQPVDSQRFVDPVTCADWRPQFEQISVCSDKALFLWSYGEGTRQKIHDFPATIETAQWSPDGRWLVAWDYTRTLTQTLVLWDGQTEQSFVVPFSQDNLWRGVWSPDSRHLIGVSVEGTSLYVWNVEQPLAARSINLDARVHAVEFVDADRFVTWGPQDVTRLWLVSGEEVSQFGIAADLIQGIAFSPNRTALLTFLSNGGAYLWDIATGMRTAVFCCHGKIMRAAAWLNDDYLVTSSKDGTARVWDLVTEKDAERALLVLRGHATGNGNTRADVLGLHWQPATQELLTYGEDGALRTWQVLDAQGMPLCAGVDSDTYPRCFNFSRAFTDHTQSILHARWLNDQTLLTTDNLGVARRYSLATGDVQVFSRSPVTNVYQTVWSPDGRYVLTYTQGMAGQVVDFAQGTALVSINGPITNAFWLDLGLLISHGAAGATLVQPETGAPLAILEGYTSAITAVQVDSKQRVALAEENGTIHIWDGVQQKEIARFGDKQTYQDLLSIHSLEWNADSTRLLAASAELTLWNLDSGEKTQYFEPLAADTTLSKVHASFSPDGQLIAVTNGTHFWVLDSETGNPLWENNDYTQPLAGVRWLKGERWSHQERGYWLLAALNRWLKHEPWNPGGTRLLLLTWGGDGTARLWDWENRAEILRLAESGPMLTAVVSPDGEQIVTTALTSEGTPGAVRIWQVWYQGSAALVQQAQRQTRLVFGEYAPLPSLPLAP